MTQPEPYTYTDRLGYILQIMPILDHGRLTVSLWIKVPAGCDPTSPLVGIPADRVEEVVAAIRAAAGQTPADGDLRQQIAEALMGWAERGNSPQYTAIRRPETVTQNAYSRADAVLPIVAAETAKLRAELEQARAAALTPSERQFLTFALDQAFERMVSDDGFTTDDWAALEKLRALADAAPQAGRPLPDTTETSR